MSDDDAVEETKKPVFDYNEMDGAFKKIEKKIFDAFMEAKQKNDELKTQEEEADPFDADAFVQHLTQETQYDENVIKAVTQLGIFGGDRDPDSKERHGNGHALYPNGDSYKGQYAEGNKHGTGVYLYKSLGKHPVDAKLDEVCKTNVKLQSQLAQIHAMDSQEVSLLVKHAMELVAHPTIGALFVEMALRFGTCAVYDGQYAMNNKHGNGRMKYVDGSVYDGQWQDNCRHGQGVMYFANGDVYRGEFDHGLKHGQGTYTFCKQQCEYEGTWEKGQIKHGQYKMADFIVYKGRFEDNVPEDAEEAQMETPQGVTCTGTIQAGTWYPTMMTATNM